jgi:4-azaleucine resistance transporter AzlC
VTRRWLGAPTIPDRRTILAAAPLAVAIGVFGVVFGAAASAEYGATQTLLMSFLVFSGAVQFAVIGSLASGATVTAVLLTVVALNARNLVLGAAMRPRLSGSRLRRALMGWFLTDESFGLAVASGVRAARVMAISGVLFYVSWQVGTIMGVGGAHALGLADVAAAIFPVLFIGLAAITASGRTGAIRAITAAAVVVVGTILVPDLHPFLPIVAALLVALPGSAQR